MQTLKCAKPIDFLRIILIIAVGPSSAGRSTMWSTTQNTDHRLVLCNGQRSAVIKRSTIRGNAMVNGHWLLCSGQQSLFPQCYYAMVDGRWLCNVHERRWLLVIMVK